MIQDYKDILKRYSNLIFFIVGFVFDALTLVRIDSLIDISLQAIYLAGISILLVLNARESNGEWAPRGVLARIWPYETEILHFFYGGLLSAYVVLYFKSTSLSRSFIFLSLVAFLMVANEMPQIRKAGSYLRLGLYSFCVISFLNYLLPIAFGQLGWWVFILAWIFSAGIVFLVLKKTSLTSLTRTQKIKLRVAPFSVLMLVGVLYFSKLIPPVPLSVQYVGFFRGVEKINNRYKLSYHKPPLHRFWQTDERVFEAAPGDVVYCFIRVFAPTRFEHRIFIKWSQFNENRKEWLPSDRIPVSIKGGRDRGFRGVSAKENYAPGRWRVEIETEDGRILGSKEFEIRPLSLNKETRVLRIRWM